MNFHSSISLEVFKWGDVEVELSNGLARPTWADMQRVQLKMG